MNIHEAIMARTHEKPYITRRDWGYITVNPVAVSIKILPTNSPDGCVVESVSAEGPRSGWQPTAGDLAAEDWERPDGNERQCFDSILYNKKAAGNRGRINRKP